MSPSSRLAHLKRVKSGPEPVMVDEDLAPWTATPNCPDQAENLQRAPIGGDKVQNPSHVGSLPTAPLRW